MSKRISIVIAFIAIALMTASVLEARQRGPRRHKGKLGVWVFKSQKIMKEAGISKAKATQIVAIMRDAAKKSIPLIAKVKINRIDMRTAMEAEQVDLEKVKAIAKKIQELKWQIKEIQLEKRVKILNLLSADEREKIRDAIKKVKRHHRCDGTPHRGGRR